MFKDGTGSHERRQRGENATHELLQTPAAGGAPPEVPGSSQMRTRLGRFMFEITEAGASTFQCPFSFFQTQSIESKCAGPWCIQCSFDRFLFKLGEKVKWQILEGGLRTRALVQESSRSPGTLQQPCSRINKY